MGRIGAFPYGSLPDYPNIIELRNRGKKGDVNQHWHTDMSYAQAPPKLTMLYALQTPVLGGETAFANQILAYQELSTGMKRLLDELIAEHSAEDLARLYGADTAEASRAEHPVVRVHEESGARALYVCRAFTRRFKDWSRPESKVLLSIYTNTVCGQSFKRGINGGPMIWSCGTTAVSLHYAVHDHGDDPRLLHRLQVQGESTL
ncbi:MAG: hypothetical protein CM15mP120_00660 [Pseudomonadota bacterium]|nr:MAG: hypothetical protein CM15mP120_00660 [Pseudomonadota bacterium]